MSTLDKVYLKLIDVLEKVKPVYMIIGGLAVGLLGEARMTQDIDVVIAVSEGDIPKLLQEAKRRGFTFLAKKIKEDVKLTGSFRIDYGFFHVDFIIGSMPFEISAFSRRKKIKLFGKPAYFSSAEDLVLFKLISGREKDILDIKSIINRQKGKIDTGYLEKWAKVIADDLENIKIYSTLRNILHPKDKNA